MLTDAQITKLNQPLDEDRVAVRPDGKYYLNAHNVIRTLNEVFGFAGWNFTIEEIRSRETDKGANYSAVGRLTIVTDSGKIVREDVGTGATLKPSPDEFDKAEKAAVSDALKRCARTLGDQFGLSLYDKEQNAERDKTLIGGKKTPSKPTPVQEYACQLVVNGKACGKILTDTPTESGKVSAKDLAEGTKTRYNMILCYDHMKEVRDAEKAREKKS